MLYFTGLVSNWHLPDVLLYWICSPVGLYQMHYFTGLGIQLVFTRHTILLDWESSWSLPDALLYWIGIQLVFTICCTLLDWYPIGLYQMLYFTGLIVQGFVVTILSLNFNTLCLRVDQGKIKYSTKLYLYFLETIITVNTVSSYCAMPFLYKIIW